MKKSKGYPGCWSVTWGLGRRGRSLPCPTDSLQNPVIPVDSSRFQRNEICHSGDNQFRRNLAIPELRLECSLEWSGTEFVGMQYLLLLPFFFFLSFQIRHRDFKLSSIKLFVNHHPQPAWPWQLQQTQQPQQATMTTMNDNNGNNKSVNNNNDNDDRFWKGFLSVSKIFFFHVFYVLIKYFYYE